MLRHPLTWGGGTGWLNPAFFGRIPIIDYENLIHAPDQAHKTSTAMAAVKAPARESLLHLVGDSTAGDNGELSTELAAYDRRRRPCGPITSTRRRSQTKRCPANNWIAGRPCRRAVDGAALYDNPPLLCKCRRAPSTQVKSGDLARVHRRMVSHTPMPHLHNSRRYPLEGYN